MTKGHDKGHKGQMSDREVMKLALEALDEGLTMKEWRELVAALRDRLAQPQTPDDLLRQSEREGWRYAKECEAEVKRLRQALEQPEQVSVPDGWKLVPIEPTDAMLSVPVNIDLRECVTPGGVTGLDAVGLFRAWEAMIEAAPQPWDTTDMAHRTGGLSMEQDEIVPSDYSGVTGDYSGVTGDYMEQEPVAGWDSIEAMASRRYKVVPSHDSMFYRHAVVAGNGTQQLYIGREVECENMARKFAGAFLDGAFVMQSHTSPPNVPMARANKPWVGLTDEEIDALAMDEDGLPNSHIEIARAIEAKLKEKNRG